MKAINKQKRDQKEWRTVLGVLKRMQSVATDCDMTPGVRLRLARARIILVKIRSRFLKEAKMARERNELGQALEKKQAELEDMQGYTSGDPSDDGNGAACSSQSTLVMGPGGVVQAEVEQAAEDHWERPFDEPTESARSCGPHDEDPMAASN